MQQIKLARLHLRRLWLNIQRLIWLGNTGLDRLQDAYIILRPRSLWGLMIMQTSCRWVTFSPKQKAGLYEAIKRNKSSWAPAVCKCSWGSMPLAYGYFFWQKYWVPVCECQMFRGSTQTMRMNILYKQSLCKKKCTQTEDEEIVKVWWSMILDIVAHDCKDPNHKPTHSKRGLREAAI